MPNNKNKTNEKDVNVKNNKAKTANKELEVKNKNQTNKNVSVKKAYSENEVKKIKNNQVNKNIEQRKQEIKKEAEERAILTEEKIAKIISESENINKQETKPKSRTLTPEEYQEMVSTSQSRNELLEKNKRKKEIEKVKDEKHEVDEEPFEPRFNEIIIKRIVSNDEVKPIVKEEAKVEIKEEIIKEEKTKVEIEEKTKNTDVKHKEKKVVKKKKKNKKITNIISYTIGIIFFISICIVYGFVLYLDVLPAKYSILFTIIILLLTGLVEFMLLNKKVKKGFKIGFNIVAVISTIVCCVISYFGLQTLDFYKKVSDVDHTITEKYYVMVKKNSKYNTIEDVNDFSIATYNENTNVYKEAINKLDEVMKNTLVQTTSAYESIEWLLNDEISVILLSNIHKETYTEEHPEFTDQVKEIHTIEVKTKGVSEEVVVIKPASEDIMTIYISGIDTYGSINLRSRSDVNMLVTVNKKNHEILLTSIPRDYYVKLHSYKSYDKLTHAGIYGVNESIKTIQDFMGIDINYYTRVNFSTLEYVVDAIGGVDVYSDKSFVPYTNKKLYIKKGMVHMDGKTALAFARERYTYKEGDVHRVQNQQDVLKAIITKVTTTSSILTKYTSILNGLTKYFQTNIDMNEVSDIVKIQLDEMPSWTIKQYNLNGNGATRTTYSMGNRELSVMIPDQTTVEQGKTYINGMSKGKTFKELGLN